MITALFVLTLSWRIMRGISSATATQSFIFRSGGLKATPVEIVIPHREALEKDDKTLDLTTYLRERKALEKTRERVQHLALATITEEAASRFYLN